MYSTYLQLSGSSDGLVDHGIAVHGARVSEVIEYIEGLNRCRAALLEPEDQVDPLVQVLVNEKTNGEKDVK
jgi:hypothetical protein